ncbi:MAG: MFS transporter [Beijerinckiaceae bacterium]|nr:MFS transporter [Beijerinckiaceae bacterium]
MTTPAGAAPEGQRTLTHREALWIVAAVLPTVFMSSLDQTMVAGALPTIGRAFGSTENLSWVASIYLLTMTATTPLFGRLSDIHGRRLVLRAGLFIFIAGGVASALAPNMMALILARAVQGVGAAGLTSQALTILGDIAPPRQRPRYYTYFALVYTTAGGLGPALGGFLAQHVYWGLVFCATAPLGALSIILGDKLLRKLPRNEKRRRLDLPGAALVIAASAAGMFVITAGGRAYSWGSTEILGLLAISGLAWAAFVYRQITTPEPLIPLHIVKSKIVMAAIGASAFGWGAIIGLNLYLPLYLQYVQGMTPAQAGVQLIALMMTVNLGALMGSLASSKMERYKLYPIVTNVLCVAAMAWLAWRTDSVTTLEFQVVLVFVGLGFGPMAPIITVVVQNSVKLSDLGAATSTLSFGRGLFSAILISVLGAVVLQALGAQAAHAGAVDRETIVGAFKILFWLTTASFALSLISFILIEEKPLQTSNEGRRG